MEQIRKRPNLRNRLVRKGDAFLNRCPACRVGRGFDDSREVQPERGEILRRGVVQLPGDAAALFVLQVQEASGELADRTLRLLSRRNVVHERAVKRGQHIRDRRIFDVARLSTLGHNGEIASHAAS